MKRFIRYLLLVIFICMAASAIVPSFTYADNPTTEGSDDPIPPLPPDSSGH